MENKRQVLFIHGGGDDGYQSDASLAGLLRETLGEKYSLAYPEIVSDTNAPDFGWPLRIEKEINALPDVEVLVAHSLGASMLLKYLSENRVSGKLRGVFLIAAPFWSGEEDWKQGLKLSRDFSQQLPTQFPYFFYHSLDDTEVPVAHLTQYQKSVNAATFRKLETGGHQLSNQIHLVARDIENRYLHPAKS